MIGRKHGEEETKIFHFLKKKNIVIIESNYYNMKPSEENAFVGWFDILFHRHLKWENVPSFSLKLELK